MLILDESGAVATIYADRDGTPLANPIITDSLGRWSFCALDGLYKALVSLGGMLKAIVPDIRLEDPSNNLLPLAAPDGAGMIGKTGGGTLQDVATAVAALSTTTGAASVGTADGGTVQSKLDGLRTDVNGLHNYTLPAATNAALGGIKVGSGLSVDGTGLLSVSYSYTLPTASGSVLGGVKIGTSLSIDGSGVLNYSLPVASAGTLGGIKVGAGLAIDGAGVLSAPGGSVSTVNGVAPVSGNITLNTDNIAESGTPTNQWFTAARVRAVVLTGLSTATNAVIAATDTILAALGKLQAQVTANGTAISGKQDSSAKDSSGGYVGLTGFSYNLKNAAGTITSAIASAATAARTWTMPDTSGTVALTSDITAASKMVLLGSVTVSSPVAAINFLSTFTSSYDKYQIEVEGLDASVASAFQIHMATGGVSDTGADATTNYSLLSANNTALSSTATSFTSPTSAIGGGPTATFTMEVRNANATVAKGVGVRGFWQSRSMMLQGVYTKAAVLSGFDLTCSSGNFTAGTVRVYGVKNT